LGGLNLLAAHRFSTGQFSAYIRIQKVATVVKTPLISGKKFRFQFCSRSLFLQASLVPKRTLVMKVPPSLSQKR